MKTEGCKCSRTFDLRFQSNTINCPFDVCFSVCAPLGVSDRNAIQDVRMTATTVFSDSCYPGNGRLNGIKGWCPRTSSDRTDYLQVDMGSVHSLCAVATQGYKGGNWRTTSYKLHLSTDGVTWKSYKENNVEKVNKLIYSHPALEVYRKYSRSKYVHNYVVIQLIKLSLINFKKICVDNFK